MADTLLIASSVVDLYNSTSHFMAYVLSNNLVKFIYLAKLTNSRFLTF